jgi:hypothetical protein
VELYLENRKQARYHELLRATGSTLITAGAALLAAITHQQQVGEPDLPLAIFIVFIGVVGILPMGQFLHVQQKCADVVRQPERYDRSVRVDCGPTDRIHYSRTQRTSSL